MVQILQNSSQVGKCCDHELGFLKKRGTSKQHSCYCLFVSSVVLIHISCKKTFVRFKLRTIRLYFAL